MLRLAALVTLAVAGVFVAFPADAQVVLTVTNTELEYDPATGLPAEAWSMPVLASSGTQPVLGFVFAAHATFDEFIMSTVSLPCAGSGANDFAAAASASFDFDVSTGVFAGAEFVQVQDEYHRCLNPTGASDRRDVSVAVVESLQGPFVGQVLSAAVPIGSITIAMPSAALFNNIAGATVLMSVGTDFVPFILPEVTYVDGSSGSVTFTAAVIDFERANSFRRGNFEAGTLTISDPVRALLYLFGGGDVPGCLDSIDANDSGALDLSDPMLVLMYLFANGPPPANPHSSCGIDQTPDALDCANDICT